jgi:hypothetical protein
MTTAKTSEQSNGEDASFHVAEDFCSATNGLGIG